MFYKANAFNPHVFWFDSVYQPAVEICHTMAAAAQTVPPTSRITRPSSVIHRAGRDELCQLCQRSLNETCGCVSSVSAVWMRHVAVSALSAQSEWDMWLCQLCCRSLNETRGCVSSVSAVWMRHVAVSALSAKSEWDTWLCQLCRRSLNENVAVSALSAQSEWDICYYFTRVPLMSTLLLFHSGRTYEHFAIISLGSHLWALCYYFTRVPLMSTLLLFHSGPNYEHFVIIVKC